jgi:hypothetical protein
MDHCLEQSARTLAHNELPLDDLVPAVLERCDVVVAKVGMWRVMLDASRKGDGFTRDVTTGEAITIAAATYRQAERKANAELIEARAGRCRPLR